MRRQVFYFVRACSLTIFQHKSAPFKVAELHRWIVVLSSREHVEEIRRAPDDTLSFTAAKKDVIIILFQ